MPSVYDLKPKFQGLLRPLTNELARAGITANQVTLAAMFLSFAAGAAMYVSRSMSILLLLPLVLFLRMALNAIDGMLAREHDKKTSLGAIYNELGDVLSDAALYLPLAFFLPFNPFVIVLVVFLGTLAEMTGVIGVEIGASRRYDGPMGKSDRAFVFGTLGLLLGLNLHVRPIVFPVLWFVAFLLVLTILNRARGALRELQGRHPS